MQKQEIINVNFRNTLLKKDNWIKEVLIFKGEMIYGVRMTHLAY